MLRNTTCLINLPPKLAFPIRNMCLFLQFYGEKVNNNLRKRHTCNHFSSISNTVQWCISFWLPWMVVFWVSDFPNKLFFFFFLFQHKRVRGKKLSETRLGLLAKWQESSPFLGEFSKVIYPKYYEELKWTHKNGCLGACRR